MTCKLVVAVSRRDPVVGCCCFDLKTILFNVIVFIWATDRDYNNMSHDQ